ncbi:MAG: hypothetical protein FJX59_03605 [Alphaproteobacteria bacterium]|nr:hypothetical protein [Alphaproteobacteria bacterium]
MRWSGEIYFDVAKLRDYCLCSSHPRGRHKARVFQSRLGFVANDAKRLRQFLLEAARRDDADFVPLATDAYGDRYTLDAVISGPSGTGIVRSTWIVLTGQRVLRFVTCFVA